MSSALNIINTEHLPEENTLLLHYNITEPGTWELAQTLSAYRSVVDSAWTLMYPNTQHPRHTDFPIAVAQGGSVAGTFAWNYGGIRGIDRENFNSERSYLVQLTIYNADEGVSQTQTPAGTVGSQVNVATGNQVTPASVVTKPTPPRRVPPRTKTPPPRPIPTPRPIPAAPKDPVAFVKPRPRREPPAPIGDPGTEIPPSGPILSAPAPIFPGIIEGPRPKDDPSSFYSPPIIYGPNLSVPPKMDDPSVYYPPTIIGPNLSYSPPGGGGGGSIGGGRIPPNTSEGETEPPKLPGTFEIPIELINPNAVPPWWQWPRNNTDPRSVEGPLNFDNPEWFIPWRYGPSGPVIVVRPRPLNVTVLDNNSEVVITDPSIIIRPNNEPPGGITNTTNPYQSRTRQSISNNSDAGVVSKGLTTKYPVDTTELRSRTAVVDGYLTKYNYSDKTQAGTTQDFSITHIDTSAVIAGSNLLFEIPIDDVSKGNTIFVSAAYLPPANVEINCALELWANDSQNRTILINAKDPVLAKASSAATLVYTLDSYSFVPGPVTLAVLAKDSQGKVIGVASRKIIIRPTLNTYGVDSDNRIRENRNITTAFGLPAGIVDLLNIDKPPSSFYVKDSKAIRLIFRKVNKTEDKFGAIVVSSSKNDSEKYKIDVFSNITEGEFVPVPNIKGQYDNIVFSESRTLIGSSTERIKLDREELSPLSHTVGIAPFSCVESEVLVSLSPDARTNFKGERQLDVYVNSSYVIRPFTIVVSKQSPTVYTISGTGPYVMETLGLIVHGKNPDNISENYVIMYANTGVDGSFLWKNVSISSGDYYSIVSPRYGRFNPLTDRVYTAKL